MQVDFLFDFASPNAYFAHKVIPEIEARTGETFAYRPVLLGGIFKSTGNKAPMYQFAGIRNKLAYEELETRRFIARHGLAAYKHNPHFPVNSVLMMRLATAAEMDGNLAAYVEAGFHFMWEDERKMDDPEIVRAALVESGFDADLMLARAVEDEVKTRLRENTDNAVARGAFGIPTVFVDDEIFFGKDRLRDVEELILARQGG
ncbi:2-hydroxychromene-2-carboxylate isomerase [Rhodomicrobium sp. R_RK_3]|uniref:2-hydroxychromene-2-carboxylate isomerase n=1 Tax=Rhodomicrobium TaxID=1068 RepID=UPI0032AED0A6